MRNLIFLLAVCIFLPSVSNAGVGIGTVGGGQGVATAGAAYLFHETWNSNGTGSDPVIEDNSWDTDGELSSWDTDNTTNPLEGAQDLLVQTASETISAPIGSPTDNVYVGCIHTNVTPASSSGDGSQYTMAFYNSDPAILQGFRVYSQEDPSNQIYQIRYYYNGASTYLNVSSLTIATGTAVYLKAYYAKGPDATVQAWYSLNGTDWTQIGSTIENGTDSTQIAYVYISRNKGDAWQVDDLRVDDADFDY